jgi:cytochrome c peroxidase
MRATWLFLLLAVAVWAPGASSEDEADADPPEVVVGERLFLETRFAQFFQAHAGGDVNAVLSTGDPVMATSETLEGPIAGPFAGQSMNCRACHLVDDAKATPGGDSRSYADFARHSPIPAREDGRTTTPRNSPSLVNAALPRPRPFLLHFDGEFPNALALVRGTLTGRNYGWLPTESATAIAHVARVIRADDGTGALARDFGGSYRRVLGGTDPTLPRELVLPRRFRLDVDRASDEQIVTAVSRLIAAYVESLVFAQDDGAFVGSPYDRFLAKNHLPVKPDEHEPPRFYRARLRTFFPNLDAPEFVTDGDGPFTLHAQPFVFGPLELEGLAVFFDPRRGNCASCHVPPTFTDFGLHNTGVAQVDYDRTHGAGAFAALPIPGLAARDADPDAFLPATPAHPGAGEPFRALVEALRPGRVDLGVWNIYRNPDFPDRRHQRGLDRLVCASLPDRNACAKLGPAARLDAAIALFKTPGLRDLGHSRPYLHTGSAVTLEDVARLYVEAAALARAGALRNGAAELRRMTIGEVDVAPLAAFLRALNEDYE